MTSKSNMIKSHHVTFWLLLSLITVLSLSLGCFKTKAVPDEKLPDVGAPSTNPELGVDIGVKVPELIGHDIDGIKISSTELLKDKRTLLIFYRGGWCPYCNNYIQQMRSRYEDFDKLGIQITFISVDTPDASKSTQNEYELPFEVLSDSDLEWHRFFNVVNQRSDKDVKKLKRMGIKLEEASGQKHHIIAHPGIFAVDETQTVRYAYADENYKVRPSPDQLLQIVKELNWAEAMSPEPSLAQTHKSNLPKEKGYDETELTGSSSAFGLKMGTVIPDLHLTTHDGQNLSTVELLKNRKTLLVFYRGGWCPYCNKHIHDVTQSYPSFQEKDVQVVFVSVDQSSKSAQTQAAYDIPFPVLSDPTLALVTFFNVLNPLDDAYLEKLKGYQIDIEGASGKTHHTVPHPSVFAIDEEMTVRFSHVDPDYKRRVSVPQLHSILKQVGWE